MPTKNVTDVTHDIHAKYTISDTHEWHEPDINEPTLDGAVAEMVEFWNDHPDTAGEFAVTNTHVDEEGCTVTVEIEGTVYTFVDGTRTDDEVDVVVEIIAEESDVEALSVKEIADRCGEVLDGIDAVLTMRDDNGNPTLTRVVFTDGTILVAGDEAVDGGAGCTWTVYADTLALTRGDGVTDGSTFYAHLREEIVSRAARAAR